MNQESLEQNLMLRRSGELPPERLRELEVLLARDAEARKTAEALDALFDTLRSQGGQEVPPLPGHTRARILNAAERRSGRRLHARFRPGIAAAAALALVLLLPPLFRSPEPPAPAPVLTVTDPDLAVPAVEDPLLTELDLLELDLLDIFESAWFDMNGNDLEIWNDFDLLEDSI